MGINVTGSIVLYDNKKEDIERVVSSFFSSKKAGKLVIVDHSTDDQAKRWFNRPEIEYIKTNNSGYGAGHNTAMRQCLELSKYHVILNPDVYFEANVIDQLFDFMEENQTVGLVMPKILYPNGDLQYLCKLLPKPSDWFFRRFFKKKNIVDNDFEMKWTGYDKLMEVPYLSGCFMFFRNSSLSDIGLFDEKFFLHCEDADISRRMHNSYKTMYYPNVEVYHEHQKDSHKSIKMLLIHVKSTVYYFNKWGWFFDKERRYTNNKIRQQNLCR